MIYTETVKVWGDQMSQVSCFLCLSSTAISLTQTLKLQTLAPNTVLNTVVSIPTDCKGSLHQNQSYPLHWPLTSAELLTGANTLLCSKWLQDWALKILQGDQICRSHFWWNIRYLTFLHTQWFPFSGQIENVTSTCYCIVIFYLFILIS